MDTRYWGPSGWQLLHTIAAANRKTPQFWTLLPYVLPCKFCRSSLSTYYNELPIPTGSQPLQPWLWKVHNSVNDKLKKGGQTVQPAPSLSEVETHYSSLLKQGCTKMSFPGWKFLFSIADNHPDYSPSQPMPDAPAIPPSSLAEKNKYNLLTPQERKQKILQFWKSVPNALPFAEWRTLWRKYAGPLHETTESRQSALRWLWKIRCGMDRELSYLSDTNFHGLCKEVAIHRSGCSMSRNARTCRRLRPSQRNTTRSHKQK